MLVFRSGTNVSQEAISQSINDTIWAKKKQKTTKIGIQYIDTELLLNEWSSGFFEGCYELAYIPNTDLGEPTVLHVLVFLRA